MSLLTNKEKRLLDFCVNFLVANQAESIVQDFMVEHKIECLSESLETLQKRLTREGQWFCVTNDPNENWKTSMFPRLISEAYAMGILNLQTESARQDLCGEMDITEDDLFAIINRAQATWEMIKAHTGRKPRHCPYCNSTRTLLIGDWNSSAVDDKNNEATLTEHNCQDCNHSFWI